MSDRRIDRIENLLQARSGRARINDLLEDLRKEEGNPDLPSQSIYIAIQQENERLDERGERPRFITSRQGEDRGWVRLLQPTEKTSGKEASAIEKSIKEQNVRLNESIRKWLEKMEWRDFESTFLATVLEKLGFTDVEITPPTRDGGIDASIKYKMGILEADGIVSAKHWHATVPPAEVQKIRGGMSDKTGIAIIVTTAEFSKAAKDEAARQDARKVCLIDGDKLVDICKSHQIGVREHPLPKLLLLDIEITQGSSPRNGTEKSVSTDSDEPDDFIESDRPSRLRDEMLGDPDKGLSPKEIAELTGYSLNTVVPTFLTATAVGHLGNPYERPQQNVSEH